MHKKTFIASALVGLLILGAAGIYTLYHYLNFSVTVEEGETAIVVDDQNHFVEALGPGTYWEWGIDNVLIHRDEGLGVSSTTIDALMSIDGTDQVVSTYYSVTTNLADSIDYAKAHPAVTIYGTYRIQEAVAYDIAQDLNMQYARGDIDTLRFTPNSDQRTSTDAAASAAYVIEKAEADAKLAAMPAAPSTPAPTNTPPAPTPPTNVAPKQKQREEPAPFPQSYNPTYRYKYDFKCRVISGGLDDARSIQRELFEKAGLTAYDSITIEVGESVKIVRNTELPCGFRP